MSGKEQFLEAFDECVGNENTNFIVVAIEGIGEKEEMIVNPRANFETKRKYYSENYNDDMQLIHNNNIRISCVTGCKDAHLVEAMVLEAIETCELVEELKTREGVEVRQAEPYKDLEVKVNGPATVFVVID